MNREITFLAAGQALIRGDLSRTEDARFGNLLQRIRSADLAFTNFEGAVLGGASCWPTKDDAYCGAVDPVVLRSLAGMGFSAVALANNHAFDLGPGGILATRDEIRRMEVLSAGIGADFSAAAAPGFRDFPFGRACLIAMHCGDRQEAKTCRALDARPDRGIPARPGVNWLEGVTKPDGSGDWEFLAADVRRHLDTIRQAAGVTDFVIVYVHHHTLGATPERVPPAYREFCRSCIEAGAHVVLGHGTPVMQGVEVFQGRPIFYNLANFVFHTRAVEMWSGRYGSKPWESCMASARFRADGSLAGLEIHPIVLGDPEKLTAADSLGRRASCPVMADRESGERILRRLADLSGEWGTVFEMPQKNSHDPVAIWRR